MTGCALWHEGGHSTQDVAIVELHNLLHTLGRALTHHTNFVALFVEKFKPDQMFFVGMKVVNNHFGASCVNLIPEDVGVVLQVSALVISK